MSGIDWNGILRLPEAVGVSDFCAEMVGKASVVFRE